MKLIPILFMSEMVRAILDDWKNWTRRLAGLQEINKDPDAWKFLGLYKINTNAKKQPCLHAQFEGKNKFIHSIKCPYGEPGDVLWVREGWNVEQYPVAPEGDRDELLLYYKATEKVYTDMKWRPSIHMPFDACRIFLRVKSVKVERLKDISEQEAIAEGIYRWKDADEYFDYLRTLPDKESTELLLEKEATIKIGFVGHSLYREYIHNIYVPSEIAATTSAQTSFITLFLSVNKPKHIDLNSQFNNPWVWAVEFEVISKTGNPDTSVYKLPEKVKNIPL